MTWSAQFVIDKVEDGEIHAVATTGDESEDNPGTLNQNTERVQRMELVMTLDDDHDTSLKVGDRLNGSGSFTG
jgi:hypothetical protein